MEQKIALVTGATSGIGQACALRLAKDGWKIIVTGRRSDRLDALVQQIEQEGSRALSLAFDVRQREATAQALASLPKEWQAVDLLVNNAGLALGLEPEWQGHWEDWEQMIDTNIKGLLTMTRLIVPTMVKRGHGHVVNIGSVAGDAAYANGAVYCATKSAVKSLTDGLRIDLVHTPIHVTLVKPGLVETEFSQVRFHGDNDRAAQVYQGIQPLTASDIADVVAYAVSAPPHVQVAEVLVLPTHQANGTVVHKHQLKE